MPEQPVTELEVATGGDPAAALIRALVPYSERGAVLTIAVGHDDGCPCEDGRAPMSGCTCEIVELKVRRL